MKHHWIFARIGAGLAALHVLLGFGPAMAQEVRYFASGWPIALAEAACGGDEGCLTQLANCPPGTDGTCTAQVATCTETRDGTQTLKSLCTVYLEGRALHLRLPDGDAAQWEKVARTTRRAVRAPSEAAPATCVTYGEDHLICFTPILDTATFEEWAAGTMTKP